MVLRYLDRGPKTAWYRAYPQTDASLGDALCEGTQADNTACDECPFWVTDEGGDHPPPDRPHLEIIDADDNSGTGRALGRFVGRQCEMKARRAAGLGQFIVLTQNTPGVLTRGYCNKYAAPAP